jgi:hypothetical protein
MAKYPKPSDQRLKAFFREALQTEPGLAGELADRLAERCVQSIDRTLAADAARAARLATEKALGKGFDPFAFSAVAVLAKKGRDGLLARLGEIETADQLRQFAEAQHICLDPALARLDEMRLAIVRGAERRIAARRAAAS